MPTRGSTLRDLARQLGVTGFWRWWASELAAMVPAAPRAALQRRRTRSVLAFDTTTATLWQPRATAGRVTMVEQATIPLEGDAAAVTAAGRAALASATRATHTASTSAVAMPSLKVVIALPSRALLRKTLTLPGAVEENLRQTLVYDIDRHTPFKPSELYFDAAVIGHDAVHGTITVDLAAARRTIVDGALKHAEAWGASVVAISPEPPGAANASRLNLLPAELRPMRTPWKRWQFWLPIAILIAVALVAVVLPVWQKREYAIALNELADQARAQAAVSETLRAELDRQTGDYNFALERKYAYPSSVQILDDVTRILPDDTWLSQLEVKTLRGKETQRELSLRGESANAGRLVTLLEDSKLFAQAAPRSPTTKIQPGPGEIFDVGAQLRPLPAPPPVAVVVADSGVAPAAAPPALPGTPSIAPPPPAPAQASLPATSAPSTTTSGTSSAPPAMPAQAPAADPRAMPGSAAATTPPTVQAPPAAAKRSDAVTRQVPSPSSAAKGATAPKPDTRSANGNGNNAARGRT